MHVGANGTCRIFLKLLLFYALQSISLSIIFPRKETTSAVQSISLFSVLAHLVYWLPI